MNATSAISNVSVSTVRDTSYDYTTQSFVFNLALNIVIVVAALLIFLVYRWFRADMRTLGKLSQILRQVGDKLKNERQEDFQFLRRLGFSSKEQLLQANWLKLVWNLNEEDLQELQGTDLVLYMKFIRYISYLFVVLMIANLTILLPTYLTGTPLPYFHISDFSVLTTVNASGSTIRIWVAFVMVVLNAAAALYAIKSFWQASLYLKQHRLINTQKLTEKDMALHSVLVRGLPRELDPVEAEAELSEILGASLIESDTR